MNRSCWVLGMAMLVGAGGAEASMSLYPPQHLLTGSALVAAPDPVSADAGSFYFALPLLRLGGPMNLGFTLHYNSNGARSNWDLNDLPEGGPWWWDPMATLQPNPMSGTNYWQFQIEGGEAVAFTEQPDGSWQLTDETAFGLANSPIAFQAKRTNTWAYFFDPRNGRIKMFENFTNTIWRIAAQVDRNGHALTYTYRPPTNYLEYLQPIRIEDDFGRWYELEYATQGYNWEYFIETVTDHAGRQVRLEYETGGDISGSTVALRHVVDAIGGTNRFTYSPFTNDFTIYRAVIGGHRLPEGNTPWTQEYDAFPLYADDEHNSPAVTRQTDAYGNAIAISYDTNAHTVAAAWPDGRTNVFRHAGRRQPPLEVSDPEGKTIGFTLNANGQVLVLSNRLGGATSFSYDTQTLELMAITNALGHEWSADYVQATQSYVNPFNGETIEFTVARVSRVEYADGTLERFSYDAAGNVTARVDRVGSVWSYEFNTNGLPVAMRPPSGSRQVFAYNAQGLLESTAIDGSSDLGVHFEHDPAGLVTGIVNAAGARRMYHRDSRGCIIKSISELSQTNHFEYDANANLTSLTDSAGQTTRYEYDLLDRVVAITNGLGHATRFAYDAMGQLSTVTDPNGVIQSNTYTFSGEIESFGLLGGARRQWRYNAEDIPTAYTLPSGAAWSFGSDMIGRSISITNPLGQAVAFERDASGRIMAHTDAAGRTIAYRYDACGRIAGVSNAVAGAARYDYDDRGLLTNILDFAQEEWTFEHSEEGLLSVWTDPLGRRVEYQYDAVGNLVRREHAGQCVVDFAHNAAGMVTQQVATASWDASGVTLTPRYDTLGRLIATEGVALQYDAEGQVTNTLSAGVAFGARYDPGGRIEELSYADGAFAVSYTYDALNRLTQVSDALSGLAIELIYNVDSQLVELRRGNGIHTSWTYDGAGRPLSIAHGALGQIHYRYDAAGVVTQEVCDLPLLAGEQLNSHILSLNYDAASQIAAAGYAYDPCGALTNAPAFSLRRNAAGQLVEVLTNGVSVAVYHYNGLGDPMECIQQGTTIVEHIHQSLPGGLLAAAENRTDGQFERYYVWTPEGRLLYTVAASGTVHYYHFDRMGNTLFLTDATGAVAQSYAYDPYGNVIATQGHIEQPFQFSGVFGARKLPGPDGLYRMGARCYDAGTGRFLSPEPLWPRLFCPASLNPYNYAYNAPTTWRDSSGLAPDSEDTAASEDFLFQMMATLFYTSKEAGSVDWLAILNELHKQGHKGEEIVERFLKQPDLPQRLAALEALARKKKAEAEAWWQAGVKRRQAEEREKAERLAARAKEERRRKREQAEAERQEQNRQIQLRLRMIQAQKAKVLEWRQNLVHRRRALGNPQTPGQAADKWWELTDQMGMANDMLAEIEAQDQLLQQQIVNPAQQSY